MSSLVGRTFGHWTVLRVDFSNRENRLAVVRCDCGTIRKTAINNLYANRSKSCGCQRRNHVTHGESHKTTEYNVWQAMLARCYNPHHPFFRHYGGRVLQFVVVGGSMKTS